MRNYAIELQENNRFCVPAVLQTIFSRHRIFIEQKEIAKNLTHTDLGYLIGDERIKKFMASKGFDYNYYRYNELPFNEPEIVLGEVNNGRDIIIEYGHHARLLVGFKEPGIYLANPKTGTRINLTIKALNDKMNGTGGIGIAKRIAS